MRLVDTHCHLQDPKFDPDRERVLARALEVLEWLVVIGDDLANSQAALALARDRVYVSAGLHPYHASHVDAAALDALREVAAHPAVIAIGETGLDYFNEFSPRADQAKAFQAQLALACELQLPAIVHNREADEDSYAILKEHIGRLPGCILHCFGSDAAFADRCVALGCYISFAGNLTFPKAQKLRDAAATVPLDRLLLETDAPYLAPQAQRGQRCEPAFVQHTAHVLADVKGVSPGEIAAQTTQNACRVYGLPA